MNKDLINNYDYNMLNERIKRLNIDTKFCSGNLLTQSVKIFYILLNLEDDSNENIEMIRNVYGFTAGEVKSVLRASKIDKFFTADEISKVSAIIEKYVAKYGAAKTKRDFKCVLLIKEFMNNEYISIESFCKDKKMEYTRFRQLLLSLKTTDLELYNSFIKYLTIVQQENFNLIDKMWDDIKDKLINGVVLKNGSYRQFDLIDYFEITNLLPIEFYHVIGKRHGYDDKALALFKTFCNNSNLTNVLKLVEIDQICNNNYEFVIENNREILTLEEKQAVRDYLVQNNIPFYQKIYLLALRRYAEGTLDIQRKIVKKKVFKR